MGEFAFDLTGAAPRIIKYKSAVTLAVKNVIVLNNADGTAGLATSTTTSLADAVGMALDTCTYSTTQGDTEAVVPVIVNPFAVYKFRICGSATAGAAAQIVTNSSASAAGTVTTITTGDQVPNNPSMDEGMNACIGGANVGQTRKITSVGATSATVTVPFLNDIAAGDVHMLLPWTPADVAGNNMQLTSDLLEADQTIAVGTGGAVRFIDLQLDFSSQTNARNKSYVLVTLDDHILNVTT